MSFGYGFSLPNWQTLSGGAAFSPAQLFQGGVQGAWYDPSDSTTLFSDRAGTTPCAAPGAGALVPVGLMLDKRVPVAQTGYYSGVFDGTNDWLSLATQASFPIGNQDFTAEFWAYKTNAWNARNEHILNDTATGGFQVWINAGENVIRLGRYGVAPVLNYALTNLSSNVWVHFAYSRKGNNFALWVNGSRVATITDTNSFAAVNGTQTIGGGSGVNSWTGYLSNIRIVKNTSVYDPAQSTITVPTTPLTAVSGTSLLTCQNATFIDNSSNAFTITVNGNTKTGQLNPFGNHAIAANDTTARPELSARVNLLLNTDTLSTQNVTTQATTYTLQFTGAGSITLSGTGSGTYSAGSNSVTCTAGTLTLTVSGTVTNADLRPTNIGSSIPAYQRVADQYTYDNVGFPRYLAFNGTSSAMSTPANVNLSSTDKVTVFAGVRKNADVSIIAEISVSAGANNGAFLLATGGWAGENGTYVRQSRGTATSFAQPATNSYPSPRSDVLTGTSDIAGDSVVLRINGAQVATSATDQGTGNYGTYPLFIGARNTSSLFLNGYIYSLIVAGSAVSAANITATETWVNNKVGGAY